jgi:hypothetical protein
MNNNSPDPIKKYARKKTAERRVGANAKCACGEHRPEALIKKIICAECDRKAQGKSTDDDHHVGGQNNSPITVSVPVNDHRAELSTEQYEWPKRTVDNPERSPLIAAAGCIRGFVDFIYYLVKKLVGWIPRFLEALDESLVKLFGSQWWISPEFKTIFPESLYAE